MKIIYIISIGQKKRGLSTFIASDIKMLRKKHTVIIAAYTQIGHILKNIRDADLLMAFCADITGFFATLIAKLFRKKSIIITGAWDVYYHKEPEMNFVYKGIPSYLIFLRCFSFVYCDKLLAVSNDAKKRAIEKGAPKGKIELCYHGIEDEYYQEVKPEEKNPNLVMTVGLISRTSSVKKGHFEFIKALNYIENENMEFYIIGDKLERVEFLSTDSLSTVLGQNLNRLHIVDYISKDNVLDYYRRAKVYVQYSIIEGFGVSVVEAMCSGCVPVVSDRGALPEVIGDSGIIVPYGNPKLLARCIEKALKMNNENAIRRAKMFSMSKREICLSKIIADLFSDNTPKNLTLGSDNYDLSKKNIF